MRAVVGGGTDAGDGREACESGWAGRVGLVVVLLRRAVWASGCGGYVLPPCRGVVLLAARRGIDITVTTWPFLSRI